MQEFHSALTRRRFTLPYLEPVKLLLSCLFIVSNARDPCAGRKLNCAIFPSCVFRLKRKMRCERSARMATSPSKAPNLITGLAIVLHFQLGFIKTVCGESRRLTAMWMCCCLREEQCRWCTLFLGP